MYIVIWNPKSTDPHISVDSRGFIQTYDTVEDAKDDSDLCLDFDDYRSYAVIEFNL